MAHNISVGGYPELTISDESSDVVSFQRRGSHMLVVDSDIEGTAAPVYIEGEDLFALREFLNELPEEAFVRPADPIETPDPWEPGDLILYRADTPRAIYYVRGPEEWTGHGPAAQSEWSGSDDLMDSLLRDIRRDMVVERRGGKRVGV